MNIALSILLAADTASAASKKKHIVKDLDTFAEQVAAAAKLRGGIVTVEDVVGNEATTEDVEVKESVDTSPPVRPPNGNRNTVRRRNQWLSIHNDYRMAWHCDEDGQANGPCPEYAPLAWSDSLFENAQEFADDLVEDCKMRSPPKPWFDDGWNLAMDPNTADFRPVDHVMGNYANQIWNGYPNNKEMSQILWHQTGYVGCADAVSDPDADKGCTASVCFYAEAGNCGMGKIKTWDDHYQKIMNSPGCGPCPEDHPKCNEE